MKETVNRNAYYDTVKGLVALNILIIHTAFWSGNSYVPDWMRNVVLLIDVPAFFYLSGACQHYVDGFGKQMRSLAYIYLKWLEFLVVYWIGVVCLGARITLRDIFLNLMYRGGNESTVLPVVMGSMWFFSVYYIVVILGSYVVNNYKKYIKGILICNLLIYCCLVMTYNHLILTVIIKSSLVGFVVKQTIKIIFYLGIFLMGYYLHGTRIKTYLFIVLEGLLVTFAINILIFNNVRMDILKSPPIFEYAVYESIFILAIVYFSRFQYSSKFLSLIGKNSLYFYFAQGISSSVLYSIVAHINTQVWEIKFLICASMNILLGIAISYVLKCYFNVLGSIRVAFHHS